MLPIIGGETEKVRDWTLYGYFGKFINITDGHCTYFRAPQHDDAELNVYSLNWGFPEALAPVKDSLKLGKFMKNVDMPVGKLPISMFKRRPEKGMSPTERKNRAIRHEVYNHLYDLDSDPEQENNLAGSPEEREYERLLKEALMTIDCPQEQYYRMGL